MRTCRPPRSSASSAGRRRRRGRTPAARPRCRCYTYAATAYELWRELARSAEYSRAAIQISTEHGFDVLRCVEAVYEQDFFSTALLPAAIAVHSSYRRAANPRSEEPDARVAHVRIRGSPGWATARGDPTLHLPTDKAFVSSVICWSAFGLASDFGSSSPFLNARIDRPRLSPSSGSLLGPKMTRTTTNTTNRCNG